MTSRIYSFSNKIYSVSCWPHLAYYIKSEVTKAGITLQYSKLGATAFLNELFSIYEWDNFSG